MATSKTLREWFGTLPEPYRTEAIAEMERQNISYCNGGLFKTDSLESAINFAFVHRDSMQGYAYWENVYSKAKAGEFDSPATKAEQATSPQATNPEVAVQSSESSDTKEPNIEVRIIHPTEPLLCRLQSLEYDGHRFYIFFRFIEGFGYCIRLRVLEKLLDKCGLNWEIPWKKELGDMALIREIDEPEDFPCVYYSAKGLEKMSDAANDWQLNYEAELIHKVLAKAEKLNAEHTENIQKAEQPQQVELPPQIESPFTPNWTVARIKEIQQAIDVLEGLKKEIHEGADPQSYGLYFQAHFTARRADNGQPQAVIKTLLVGDQLVAARLIQRNLSKMGIGVELTIPDLED